VPEPTGNIEKKKGFDYVTRLKRRFMSVGIVVYLIMSLHTTSREVTCIGDTGSYVYTLRSS